MREAAAFFLVSVFVFYLYSVIATIKKLLKP